MTGSVEPARGVSCHTLRVRYPETDRMGIVHHSHYLVWFELGRTELMRERGVPYGELEDREGLFFPVVQAGARYHAPARYDDVLTVHTRVTAVRGATVRFDYEITRAGESGRLTSGFTEHATVGRDGRPLRIPAALRLRLSPVEGADR